jgi:hypothetical protein
MIRPILFLILPWLSIKTFGISTVPVKDAVEKNMIRYSIVGSWDLYDKKEVLDADGQYFGKCLTIKLQSRIDSAVWISFDNGLMLMCDDTATQDMIITKGIYVQLEPKQHKIVQLYAMCAELHDGMPHMQTRYSVGNMADNNLVSVTQAIEYLLMNNIAGQGAVWAYTDGATEDDLRKYGATDNSLRLTIYILNEARVKTKLNPPIAASADSVMHGDPTTASFEDMNDDFISIPRNVFYSACGFMILLLCLTLFSVFRKRKRIALEEDVIPKVP